MESVSLTRDDRANVVPLRRLRRRQVWRKFQRCALLVVLAAAAVAWAWPTYVSNVVDLPDRQEPRVIRGGDGWGGYSGPSGSGSKTTLSGRVTHVRDGDTIEVRGTPVRLANLDCAESGTAAGTRATQYMRKLVSARQVDCLLQGRTSYDREVGTCRLSGGKDLGAMLISQGLCQRWR